MDVLVVGSPDPDDLDDAAREAERTLGREVDVRRVRPQSWDDPTAEDAFLVSVRARPLLELNLTDGEETP